MKTLERSSKIGEGKKKLCNICAIQSLQADYTSVYVYHDATLYLT